MSEEKNNGFGLEGFSEEDKIHDVKPITGMYESWFLEYASYVILERAVPAIEDGLKPVHRRILHAMKELDDGRFNKVANIIGSTMQFHPHGDASISDAIVTLGQKDLLIETQGNWGDIRTGDGSAAPRYIEARLSKLALYTVFNPQTTDWQLSYDGRKKEPITLPVKFPLLLAQGVEGIAVGLSTKILPHNFIELIDASIAVLKKNKTNVLPDFPTGGMADFTDYKQGIRGSKVRVRAKIEELDNKTLAIRNIPYGTTTTSLIDSIVKANDKGKFKIKKVIDNTAKDVEILVGLSKGQSPNIAIDALYAFTDCEVSISPNACVIIDEKPHFITVDEILRISTNQTVELLNRELEIRKSELLEKILFGSLERIFIENRIYRDIEECETWEAVISTIDVGLDPYKKQFYREITVEDIVRLTEIKIKRISKFDSFKADELVVKLDEELKEVEYNLEHLTDYAIRYFDELKEKYGKGKERKTEIKNFDTISATIVAANNQKLYVNKTGGFIGYGIKKDEYLCECSDIDDIIVFRRDGIFQVVRIAEKVFVGKDILYAGVFKKNDERMVYNMIYLDGKSGKSLAKRFHVLGITRDKEYDLTAGNKGSRILYMSANPNGEAEVVTIHLSSGCRARIKVFDYNFADLEIKGRSSRGNTQTKYPVRRIQLRSEGVSTLGGLDLWYDSAIGRLNRDGRGDNLGNFKAEDLILAIYYTGEYEITSLDLTNRYDPEKVAYIEKFDPEKIICAIYYDGKNKSYFVKRFQVETTSVNKKFNFISEDKGSKLILSTTNIGKIIQVNYDVRRKDGKKSIKYGLDDLIDVKGWKAQGNRLSTQKIKSITLINGEAKTYDVNKPQVKFEKNISTSKRKMPAKDKAVKSTIPEQKKETTSEIIKSESSETENIHSIDIHKPLDEKVLSEEPVEDDPDDITIPETSETDTPKNDESHKVWEEHPEIDQAEENKVVEDTPDESFDVGSTVDFDINRTPDTDQLGLFEIPEKE